MSLLDRSNPAAANLLLQPIHKSVRTARPFEYCANKSPKSPKSLDSDLVSAASAACSKCKKKRIQCTVNVDSLRAGRPKYFFNQLAVPKIFL
jgi:hypothetical protein